MKLFEKYNLGNLELHNRMVMPPMCMYSVSKKDGIVTPFHIAHYTARAIGKVGLIIVESTGITDNGRISDYDLGLWDDGQVQGFKNLVDSVHYEGSKIAIQLNHAGRKSETKNLRHIGPSAIEFNDQELNYEEASVEDINEVIKSFGLAAKRADEAGFDGLEIHAAHGYLLSQFISPLSNKRDDEYGKDRFLLLKQVTKEITKYWPEEKPLWIRISATDFRDDGLKVNDWIDFLNKNPNLYDIVHVSGGGVVNTEIHAYPGYMLQYAKRIKDETSYPTIGVGLLNTSDIVSYTLENEEADLVACGRELLRNPNFLLKIAKERKVDDFIHPAYKRAFR